MDEQTTRIGGSRRAPCFAFWGRLVSAAAQPVDGGHRDQLVAGEGLSPLADVKIAGHDGGFALVAFIDDFLQIPVLGASAQSGLSRGAEVISDFLRF